MLAGKQYILSTGGAAGSFTCGSDAGFQSFIQKYLSANLVGVDFDIEAGQVRVASWVKGTYHLAKWTWIRHQSTHIRHDEPGQHLSPAQHHL